MNHSDYSFTWTDRRTYSAMNYRDISTEEMDWSDSCLDASNNSIQSPTGSCFHLPSEKSCRRRIGGTSPSTLLSSLNISESSRQPFSPAYEHKLTPSTFSHFSGAPRLLHTMPHSSKFTKDLELSDEDAVVRRLDQHLPVKMSKMHLLNSSSPFPLARQSCDRSSSFQQSIVPTNSKPLLDEEMVSPAAACESDVEFVDDPDTNLKQAEHCTSSDLKELHAAQSRLSRNNVSRRKPLRSACCCMCKLSLYAFLSLLVLFVAAVIHSSIFMTPVCITNMNMSLVHSELKNNVFGQNLAIDIITDSISEFLSDRKKQDTVLTLSFQGWTGIGKNHVSNILGHFVSPQNLHRFIVTLHFTKSSHQNVEKWVVSKVNATCGIHLFVMDEMDKASEILVSSLRKAVYSTREILAGRENTKVIIILLSNTGSLAINAFTSEAIAEGHSRDNIEYAALLDRLQNVLQDTWYTDMMNEKLIDRIVPFLPLERQHVEKCAAAALESRGAKQDNKAVAAVVDRLAFSPPSTRIFSTTGCRKVNAELDLLLY